MADTNQPSVPTGPCTHIGIEVKNLEKTVELFTKVFGWGPWERRTVARKGILRGEPISYEGLRAWTKVGSVLLEIGETHGESTHTEFQAEHGGGIHHLAFDADDVKAIVDKLEELGLPLLQAGIGEGGKYDFAYINTESITGSNLILEFLPTAPNTEFRKGLDKAFKEKA